MRSMQAAVILLLSMVIALTRIIVSKVLEENSEYPCYR